MPITIKETKDILKRLQSVIEDVNTLKATADAAESAESDEERLGFLEDLSYNIENALENALNAEEYLMGAIYCLNDMHKTLSKKGN